MVRQTKKSEQISCGKIVGESRVVSTSDIHTWKEKVWDEISCECDENNVYNANETALFHKMTPSQERNVISENCQKSKSYIFYVQI